MTAASHRVAGSAAAAAASRPPASARLSRRVARAGHPCALGATATRRRLRQERQPSCWLGGRRALDRRAAAAARLAGGPRVASPAGPARLGPTRAPRPERPGRRRAGQGPPAALPGQRGPGGRGARAQWAAPGDDAGGGRLQDVHDGRDHAERAHRAVRRPPARRAWRAQPGGAAVLGRVAGSARARSAHGGGPRPGAPAATSSALPRLGSGRRPRAPGAQDVADVQAGPGGGGQAHGGRVHQPEAGQGVWHRPGQCVCVLGLGRRALLGVQRGRHAAARAAVRLRDRREVPGGCARATVRCGGLLGLGCCRPVARACTLSVTCVVPPK